MSALVRIQSSLQIKGTVVDYSSRPTNFTGSCVAESAPSPARINATPAGTVIDLSRLTLAAYYRIMNMDAVNWVEYGVYVASLGKFCPWGELLAGESYVGRFSRNIFKEDTGTGHTDPDSLMVVAHGGNVEVLLEAFEA